MFALEENMNLGRNARVTLFLRKVDFHCRGFSYARKTNTTQHNTTQHNTTQQNKTKQKTMEKLKHRDHFSTSLTTRRKAPVISSRIKVSQDTETIHFLTFEKK